MKIALCLLAHENSDGVMQNRYFPLSIGLIAEFLKLHDKNLEIDLFKKPSELSKYIETENPDIVMFGNYMWIEKLNCFYAKEVKRKNKKILTVFGGPNFSIENEKKKNFLKKNPQIDFLIEGDGEIVAKLIVENFEKNKKNIDLTKKENIPNTISITNNGKVIIPDSKDFRIGVSETKLENIPSPYLSGIMDKFFEDGTIPLLESNRGCPYSCTFCQQGTKYFSKIRYYDHERIKDELIYIAKKIHRNNLDMDIVEFTDPNFGMYKNDIDIFHHIRFVQDKFNFPGNVWCSSGKSQYERILDTAKILKKGSIMVRATVQSMNNETLKNIKRVNLPADIFKKMASEGVETYSDVMLGLPGETKKSYIDGILSLIDYGIDEFSMLQTILLKGTEMEHKEYINKHKLKTKFRIIPECDGVYKVDKASQRITETEEIIYETKTLSYQDLLECRKFSLLVHIFHNTRLLRPLYKYLDHKKINRSEIIFKIYEYCKKNETIINKLLDEFVLSSESELSDKDHIFDISDDISEMSSNKIYKFLTLALINYKKEIIKIINDVALEHFSDAKIYDKIIGIISSSIFSLLENKFEKTEFNLNNEEKKYLNSDKIIVEFSNFQQKQINYLKSQYKTNKEIVSNMAFYLRPLNMIKSVTYINCDQIT
jgi:radical SAM superfamily enzyme YgiQ (UPF0313 family)